MTLESFWYEHADAAGAALIVAVLAVIALLLIIRRYERLARGQRVVYRTRLAEQREQFRQQRQDLLGRYRKLLSCRVDGFDDHATSALAQAASPLTDAYVFGQTVADVPSPYAPTFYRGGAR